jgi:hypothetical protein
LLKRSNTSTADIITAGTVRGGGDPVGTFAAMVRGCGAYGGAALPVGEVGLGAVARGRIGTVGPGRIGAVVPGRIGTVGIVIGNLSANDPAGRGMSEVALCRSSAAFLYVRWTFLCPP